jgi:hypothetical protein
MHHVPTLTPNTHPSFLLCRRHRGYIGISFEENVDTSVEVLLGAIVDDEYEVRVSDFANILHLKCITYLPTLTPDAHPSLL